MQYYDAPFLYLAPVFPIERGYLRPAPQVWQLINDHKYYYNPDGCTVNERREIGGKWNWFNGAGIMVCNVWYMHNESWYYLGSDGAMLKGLQDIGGKWYCLDAAGQLIMEPVTLTPDKDGALQYTGIG